MPLSNRLDSFFFFLTYKISLALNWITGKEPKKFFNTIVMVIPLSLAHSIVQDEGIFFNVLVGLMFSLIVVFSYLEKYQVEILKVDPMEYSFSRVWWGSFFFIMLILLPFGDVLSGIFFDMVCGLLCYCKYCYLHDIPPRENAFSRAKNKIKDKLGSFSLVPQPG